MTGLNSAFRSAPFPAQIRIPVVPDPGDFMRKFFWNKPYNVLYYIYLEYIYSPRFRPICRVNSDIHSLITSWNIVIMEFSEVREKSVM